MADIDVNSLMEGREESERIEIAERVGAQLCAESLSDSDRKAAEALAWYLAGDAILRVRVALSHALKNARFLPKETALKIAHDVDDVACPFLSVTEVFTDDDWEELVKTISEGALAAVAARTSMSEGLAVAVARESDIRAAGALIDNPEAPMTVPVCDPLIEKHGDITDVMDKLSERPDLHPEIATKLLGKVSAVAKEKLVSAHGKADHISPVIAEAEIDSIVNLVKQTSTSRLGSVASQLHQDNKLDHTLLLAALRNGAVDFFASAMTLLTDGDLLKIKRAVRLDGPQALGGLLKQANIPLAIHADFWQALEQARGR